MEECHSESGTSPFVAQNDDAASANTAEDGDLVLCPRCNEEVTLAEIDQHDEFHEAEEDEEGSEDAHEPIAHATVQASQTSGYRSPYANSSNDVLPVIKKYGHKHAGHSHTGAKNHQSGAVNRWKHILGLPSASGSRATGSSSSSSGRPRKRLGVSCLAHAGFL